uniref:Uncharacterized protein n=1 Tax=Nelumbo nucifera TaxID=4432 RepID=A0A822YPM6_NELNU|nr:TPA_asm: hypothetical protein HUJ06_005180 [Nelumbo nucifera]
MDPIADDRKIRVDDGLFCDNCRFSVETKDTGLWKQIPERRKWALVKYTQGLSGSYEFTPSFTHSGRKTRNPYTAFDIMARRVQFQLQTPNEAIFSFLDSFPNYFTCFLVYVDTTIPRESSIDLIIICQCLSMVMKEKTKRRSPLRIRYSRRKMMNGGKKWKKRKMERKGRK